MVNERGQNGWSGSDLRQALERAASSNGQVSANVFFGEDVPAEDLTQAVERACAEAAAKTGGAKPTVGKVRSLAKSVSVTGDPETIAALAEVKDVKAVLPSAIEDIYPKPVRRSKVPEE
jgi:hypothetical protein